MPEKETKPYDRAQVEAFRELHISSATDKEVVIRMLRKIYDPSNPSNPHQLNFRVKIIRNDISAKLRKALNDRKFLNELPDRIPKGDLDDLAVKLYNLAVKSHRLRGWGGWGLSKRSESASSAPPVSSVASTPRFNPNDQRPFEFTKATVLPNVDIQIIRANRPDKSVAYRLCDFIRDEWELSARSGDGSWVDGSRLQIGRLKAALLDTKHLKSQDETLWWSPLPLHLIDASKVNMQAAEDEEILLTNANFFSSLQRYVEINFPHLGPGNPSIQEEGYIEIRPIITLIVRSEDATGGAFPSSYESNISSPGPLSSVTSSTSDPKRFSRSRKERAGDILDPNSPLLGQRHSSPPRREPRGKERFSLPRSERSGYTRDPDAPLVGQHHKDKPPASSSTGLQYSPSTAHWIGGGPTKGQVLTGPFEKRKKDTMSKASAERDSKRRKLDHKIQSKLENLGSEFMSYINEFTTTKDRALSQDLAPHIDLATQFLNTLTPRFENSGSNDTEEKMVDFFETALDILYRTASFREGVISDHTIPLMTTLLQKILTAIGDLDVDTSDEPILTPAADMAILILESAFQKLEQEDEDRGLFAICGISTLVLNNLITKLVWGPNQRDMVSVIKLGQQLLREISAELLESNEDSHLGHLLAIGTAITVKLQEKVDGVRDDEEDDEIWMFNTTNRLLVLSIERMMSGLKDGTAEAKVNRRWYHLCHLLELAEDSPLIKLSDDGYEGLIMALVEMTKRIFGSSNELLEQVIVLLDSLAPIFELYGTTMGKIQLEIRHSPELLTYILEMGAVIYNEVMLELRQSGAEFITLANAVSDFTKICSLFLDLSASAEREKLDRNQAKLDSLRVMANFLESLSTMHQPSDENSATGKAEDENDFEPTTLKRSNSLQKFYRSYSDLQKDDEEAFETKTWETETEQSHFDRLERLLKFIEGESIQSTADDGGLKEWKFDPGQSALHRAQEILGFMRSQTDSSLNSSILKLEDIPEYSGESSEEGSEQGSEKGSEQGSEEDEDEEME